MNRDYQGWVALLQRLQIPVEIRMHSTAGTLPQAVAQKSDPVAIGDILLWPEEQGEWLVHGAGCLAHLDFQAQRLELWPEVNGATERFFWHSFLGIAVAFYLGAQGYTPWHGAGLQDLQGRLWLLGGYSHGGKSTLTIGLLAAGWHYLSDDLLFLMDWGGQVIAQGWQGNSLLDPILAETYPSLLAHLGAWVGQRRMLDLAQCYPEQWRAEGLPRFIVFPVLDPTVEVAELRPVGLGYALATLMQHGAPWVLAAPDRHLPRLRNMCLQSQCYALHLGPIARTQPERVAEILTVVT